MSGCGTREPREHPRYADFKAALYGLIDPKFRGYFSSQRTSMIRLDEVRWGGVVQDGIPPLRGPEMISAKEATYLDDDNVIFGLEVEGDVRAYPKRILAWHEMFVDTVGGVPVAGVYCTLCGTMILYETMHDGVAHELGTSGFLYRSNKLMYDQGDPIAVEHHLGPAGDRTTGRSGHRAEAPAAWSPPPGASGAAATPTPRCSPSTPATPATTPKAPPTATTSPPTS